MKNRIYAILISLIVCVSMYSCKQEDVSLFKSQDMLYIPNSVNENIRFIPFYHNPGKEQIEVKFLVNLIGQEQDVDREYKIVVVDSLTTANKEDYELDKFIFRKGLFEDTLTVKVNKTAHLSTKLVTLTLELVPNENFNVAYESKKLVEISFDNLVSRPEWWDSEVEEIYLGAYSQKKYELLFIATGVSSIENLEPAAIRDVALKLKVYISKNGITEDGGLPMIIPIY